VTLRRALASTGAFLWLAASVVLLHPAPAVDPITFEDVTAQSRIDFVLENSATPEKHQIETMVGGVALLDYDRDGLLDIFFTNGARQPSLVKDDPRFWNRLYRNQGNGVFEDVTARAGVRGEGYSMAAAVADYDNDGYPDLFVAGVGRNILYRNRGDGTFEDVTVRAGIRPEPWSIGGGWFDADGDGRLDLFIVNYVEWDPQKERACVDPRTHERRHCHPDLYHGLPNRLYRNNGDGTFTDISESAGISRYIGKGMSVALADYDGDGRTDVLVTNDTQPNFLFHNEGGGKFREVALSAGLAFNDDGRALSSMGADFRDFDNDGRPDIFLTALSHETFPLYRNLGKGLFADFTYRSRVGAATMGVTGWSNGIFDFNNDGRKDLFAANGDLDAKGAQSNLVMAQRPDGTFDAAPIGPPALYRGAAFGDLDNDGRIDIVVTRIGARPLLLRNTSARQNHWLGLDLPIGAQARVNGQTNHATTAVGYASASDPRVHFGLGAAAAATVEIHLPDGKTKRLENVRAGQYVKP
jgi:hypothetical protein